MSRSRSSTEVGSRTARLKKKVRREPYWAPLEKGKAVGYRKLGSGKPGTWIARLTDPTIIPPRQYHAIGDADDLDVVADGASVFTWAQAQEEARKWFRKVLAGEAGEQGPRTGPLTVAQAVEVYLDLREREGMKSARDARNRVRLHVLPQLGLIPVTKLTRARLQAWRDALAASPRSRKKAEEAKPVEPRAFKDGHRRKERPTPPTPKAPETDDERRARRASANRVLSTLKAALTSALDHGLVHCPDDAWRRVKPFRSVEEARQDYLTPDQQIRLVNSIGEPDFKRLVIGALTTGARYGELIRMQVQDFDPNPGGPATVLIREGKDGKPRRAMLTTEGREFFEEITAGRRPLDLIFQKDPDPRLKAVKRGELKALPWEQADQIRRMTLACEGAGLPVMGFHQLRHSYASALVSAGMPLAMVAKLTGHADTRMLEKHYAHLAPSDLSRSLEASAPKLGLEKPKVATLKLKKKA